MKKRLIVVLSMALALIFAVSFTAIAAASVREMDLPHYDQLEDKPYNSSLFYRNDLKNLAADPAVIYINHGRDEGYFYAYATSDQIGATGYQCWRSNDLAYWEPMGVAFVPDRNSWGYVNYWAPEVIYHELEGEEEGKGKYYLFYNAWDSNHSKNYHAIGMAVADNPWGPFVQYTGTQFKDRVSTAAGSPVTGVERDVDINTPWLDREGFRNDSPLMGSAFIDASPFVDPQTGIFYLYFVLDVQTDGVSSSSIWGIQLTDKMEPMYPTATQITTNGKTKVNDGANIVEGRSNEAPCVLYKDGVYYMTYSIFAYESSTYSVAQAIGTTPLDPNFEKVSRLDGGRFLTATGIKNNGSDDPLNSYYPGFMAGTGHHSFAYVGDEVYALYHAYADRLSIEGGRAIAVDKIQFVTNGKGKQILYTNGPSFAIQPLPKKLSQYHNLSDKATITANNGIDGNGVEYLNDGLYKNHNYAFIKNFHADKSTTITITFDKEVDVRAIMVYQGFSDDTRFDKVDRISIQTTKTIAGLKFKGNAIIKDLGFDQKNIFVDINDPDDRYLMAGGSCTAEFNELRTKSITIDVKGVGDLLAIGEIVILGKEVK